MSIVHTLTRHASNIPGWRSDRRIVVMESDDWGSIGTPSKEAYDQLDRAGIITGGDVKRYIQYDALESNRDLELLFELLSAHSDHQGNPAVFTAFCLPANPDFERIESGDFKTYHWEPVDRTAARYPEHDRLTELWKSGRDRRVFIPQLHGREHLNVRAWMGALEKEGSLTRKGFSLGFCGMDSVELGESPVQFRAAFDLLDPSDLEEQERVIREGTELFRQLLGAAASVFVPPNGPFNLSLAPVLKQEGIRYLVLDKLQREPLGRQRYRRRLRFPGMRNRLGQYYLSRNASFEPCIRGTDWVERCMNDVERAFRWKKPAVISTHRVNYMGFLDPSNREHGLEQLHLLLKALLRRWPDLNFMSTDMLGDLMAGINR